MAESSTETGASSCCAAVSTKFAGVYCVAIGRMRKFVALVVCLVVLASHPRPATSQGGPEPQQPGGIPVDPPCETYQRRFITNLKRKIFDGMVTDSTTLSLSINGNEGVQLVNVASSVQCRILQLQDAVVQYIRGPVGSTMTEVEILAQQTAAGISNLLWDDRENLLAVAGTAIMGLQDEEVIMAGLVDYTLTYMSRSSTILDFVVSSAIAVDVPRDIVRDLLTGIFASIGTPDTSDLEELIRRAAGGLDDGSAEPLWVLFQEMVATDLLLKRGSVQKLLKLADKSNASPEEMIRILAIILTRELGIDYADAEPVATLVVVEPTPQYQAEVATLVALDLASEDKPVVNAIMSLTAGSSKRERTVQTAISGIIKNVLAIEGDQGTDEGLLSMGAFGAGVSLVQSLRVIDVAETLSNLAAAEKYRKQSSSRTGPEKGSLDGSQSNVTPKSDKAGRSAAMDMFDFSESRQPRPGASGGDTYSVAFDFVKSREQPGSVQEKATGNKPASSSGSRGADDSKPLARDDLALPESGGPASNLQSGFVSDVPLGRGYTMKIG